MPSNSRQPARSCPASVDDGTPASKNGQSIEERADAGISPTGDQNTVRAFVDRPLSAGGQFAGIIAEGFLPGETVDHPNCFAYPTTASTTGSVAFGLGFGTGGFLVGNCTLVGLTSGRVARYSLERTPGVINARGLLISPTYTQPGGNVVLVGARVPPNDIHTVFLDGVALGTINNTV